MKPRQKTRSESGRPKLRSVTIRLRPGESTEETVERFRRLIERRKAREDALADTPERAVPFEELSTLQMVRDYFADPESWLDHPNPVFGGRTPRSLLGTSDEAMLRDRLIAAEYGLFL
jgi:uncharacterized protein (DUF2384 family)